MKKADLERLKKYTAGYRLLMKGGLDSQIHTASTKVSELTPDQFAYIDVADIEWLVSTVERLTERLEDARVKSLMRLERSPNGSHASGSRKVLDFSQELLAIIKTLPELDSDGTKGDYE